MWWNHESHRLSESDFDVVMFRYDVDQDSRVAEFSLPKETPQVNSTQTVTAKHLATDLRKLTKIFRNFPEKRRKTGSRFRVVCRPAATMGCCNENAVFAEDTKR